VRGPSGRGGASLPGCGGHEQPSTTGSACCSWRSRWAPCGSSPAPSTAAPPTARALARCEISGAPWGSCRCARLELRGHRRSGATTHESRATRHGRTPRVGQKTKHQPGRDAGPSGNARGQELWSASRSMLLRRDDGRPAAGARSAGPGRVAPSPSCVASSLAGPPGREPVPADRGQPPRHASRAGAHGRGVLPPAAGPLVYWVATVALGLLLAFAWASAAFGGQPAGPAGPVAGRLKLPRPQRLVGLARRHEGQQAPAAPSPSPLPTRDERSPPPEVALLVAVDDAEGALHGVLLPARASGSMRLDSPT